MSKIEKVQIARLGDGYVNTQIACAVLRTARLCRRVVEAEMLAGDIVLYARVPLPRAVEQAVTPLKVAKRA